MLTTGFVLTGQGVHQDVDSARIRHQPGGGQPGEVSSGVPFLTKAVTFSNLKFKFLEVQNCLDFHEIFSKSQLTFAEMSRYLTIYYGPSLQQINDKICRALLANVTNISPGRDTSHHRRKINAGNITTWK